MVFGADTDFVARRVEVEVDKIRELPDEVEDDPVVTVKQAAFPVLIINLAGLADPGELKRWVDRLERDLVQISGVASMFISGLTDPQIWVECDPTLLIAHDLTAQDVIAAVERWSVNVPGGFAEADAKQTLMRTVGQVDSVGALENVPVRSGSDLRLKDVARLREARRRPLRHSRFNGQPSINLYVQKTDDANAVEISRRSASASPRSRKSCPKDRR